MKFRLKPGEKIQDGDCLSIRLPPVKDSVFVPIKHIIGLCVHEIEKYLITEAGVEADVEYLGIFREEAIA
jgi:hypothetical protein